MRLIVVDIQGFNLPEFYPKEISFVNEHLNSHYLVKPPMSYGILSNDIKKQVKYLERNHHGLRYNSGCISDNKLN